MRAKFCTHTVLALVSMMVLGITEVTMAQTTTTTTTTTTTKKESSKKSSKKEEKKAETVVAPAAPVAAAPEVVSQEVRNAEAAKVESKHKFSGYIGFDYYFEPLADDDQGLEPVLEKEYKKQRAIVYPGVTYTYNKQWALGFYPEFRYNNGHQLGGYPTNPGKMEYARSIVSLMRKGVLNEKEHGVNLEMGYVRRLFNKGVFPTNYGNHRFRTVLSKNVNDSFNFSIFNEVLYNATEKWANTSWKFIDNIKPTLNFTFSEKLTFSMIYDINVSFYHRDIKDQHKKDFTSENHHILTYALNDTYSVGTDLKFNYNYNRKGNPDQSLIFAPYTTINLTPATSLSFEVAWTYSAANDGEDGFAPRKNVHQYPDLAIYFFHSI